MFFLNNKSCKPALAVTQNTIMKLKMSIMTPMNTPGLLMGQKKTFVDYICSDKIFVFFPVIF